MTASSPLAGIRVPVGARSIGTMSSLPTNDQVQAALATVNDPEIRRPITDLGMVKSIEVGPAGDVRVAIYLTVAGCPMRETDHPRASRRP